MPYSIMKNIVFAPLSNTLSHICDCLAVAEKLNPKIFNITFLCSTNKKSFLVQHDYRAVVTREIWEGIGEQRFMQWFEDPLNFYKVLMNERAALVSLKPELVIGAHRYTTKLNCNILGVPFYSIMHSCLHPRFDGFLGVPDALLDPHAKDALRRNYQQIANRLTQCLDEQYSCEIPELRSLLPGDKTFFSVLPDFQPLETNSGDDTFVGPLRWSGWQSLPDIAWPAGNKTRVLVFMGSVVSSQHHLQAVITLLNRPDLHCTVVAPSAPAALPDNVKWMRSANLQDAIHSCDLAIVHGGVNVVHQCLQAGKACVIIPSQLEQCQNALIAQTIGFALNPLLNPLSDSLALLRSDQVAKRLTLILDHNRRIESQELDQAVLKTTVEAALSDPLWNDRCRQLAHIWQPRFSDMGGAASVAKAIEQYCQV